MASRFVKSNKESKEWLRRFKQINPDQDPNRCRPPGRAISWQIVRRRWAGTGMS